MQYLNNNFKTSLVICPRIAYGNRNMTHPKLLLECTLNSDFSANYEDNENDQDNENHPHNKM